MKEGRQLTRRLTGKALTVEGSLVRKSSSANDLAASGTTTPKAEVPIAEVQLEVQEQRA